MNFELSAMFDRADRQFYESEIFQELAMKLLWSELYRRVRDLLRSFQGRTTHYGPQDVAIEAMRKTLREFPEVVSEILTSSARRVRFKGILFKIAGNEVRSFIRNLVSQEKSLRFTVMEEDLAVIDESSNRDSLATDLEHSPNDSPTIEIEFAKLSVMDQEVLRLHCIAKLKHMEIAQLLGCTEAAARVRCHYAQQRFKNLLRKRPEFNHLFIKGGSNEK